MHGRIRNLTALIALLALTLGCKTLTVHDVRRAGADGDLETLKKAWSESDRRELRIAVMEEAQKFGGFDRAERFVLEYGMTSLDGEIRLAATRAAGEFYSEAMIQALIERLSDDLPQIRETAKMALAKRGPGARPFLETALVKHPHPDVRRAAALLLARLPSDESTDPILIEVARGDAHPMVREAAVLALGQLQVSAARPTLTKLVHEDADAKVRMAAERALTRMGERPDGRRVVAVWPIKNNTGDEGEKVLRYLDDARAQLRARLTRSKICEIVDEDEVEQLFEHWKKLGNALYDGDAPNVKGPGFAKIANEVIYGSLGKQGDQYTLVLSRLDAGTSSQVPGGAIVSVGFEADLNQMVTDAAERLILSYR